MDSKGIINIELLFCTLILILLLIVNLHMIEKGLSSDIEIHENSEGRFLASHIADSINEVNSNIPDTSGLATKDLDNLTATGKDKTITLAHELDFANASSISTTSSSSAQAYTCPDDGVIILQVSSYSTSSSTKGSHVKLWCNSNVVGEFWTGFGGGVANTADYKSLMYHYKKGDYAPFIIYSTGYGSNTVSARFVPYKKA